MYVALLALNAVLFALLTAAYWRSKACSLFHPLTTYLAFHGVVFVLRPITSWYYGYQLIYKLYQFSPDAYAKDMTLVAANVGLFSFAAASLHWGREPFRNRSDRFTAMELRTKTAALWVTVAVLLPLIVWSLYSGWEMRSSNLDTLVLDSATGTTINTSGNGYVQSAFGLGVVLIPLLAWAGGFRWWSLIPALLFAVAQAGSGTRGPVVSEMVALGGLYLYARQRRSFDWRVVGLVVATALAFNAVGADRGAAIRSLVGAAASQSGSADEAHAPLEGMDLGNLEYFEFLVDKVPRATGTFEYFVDNLQVFTEPVPRVLWKNKPIGQPVRFFSLFDYGFPIGMTRSLPGEGWVQLGLVGVVIWCGLWGGICGAIYNRYVLSRQGVIATALYMTFLSMLIVFYRDGVLMTILKQSMFYVAPVGLWALLARLFGAVSAHDLRRLAAVRLTRARLRAAGETAMSGAPAGAALALPRSRRHSGR